MGGVYLYNYNIVEVISYKGRPMHHPLVNYSSNAAPPQLGSRIDVGEFITGPEVHEYLVIDLLIIPRNTDFQASTSDTTYIRVFVEKLTGKNQTKGQT